MKRKLTVAIVLMALIALCVSAQAAPALPEQGQSLYGFEVLERGTLDLAGAQTALLEHTRSGAQLLIIQNQDINRSFDITFRTPALDDRGTSHVFEHLCINGSDRYPAQNLFFALSNLTYNTFVNAVTGANLTSYPVASLSEAQLMTMMDCYMSGVLHPLVYEEKRLVDREAWRYELEDEGGEITLNGTVYSEMKGSYNLTGASYLNLKKTLMPGTIAGNVSGGKPEAIPQLAWEDLISYHQSYYHPSNALIILYGDLNYAPFLEALDRNYLSAYERREIEIDNVDCPPLAQMATASYEFPAAEDIAAENGSAVHYALSLTGANQEDLIGMQALCYMLTHESSALTAAVRQAMPSATLSAAVDTTYDSAFLCLSLTGANPGDEQTLRQLADQHFAQLAENGPDAELCQAVLSQLRYSTLTMGETSDLGVNLSLGLASQWASGRGLNYYNDYLEGIESMEAQGAPYFAQLANRYLSEGNPSRALTVTSPVPGGAQEEAQALAEQLKQYKDGLSPEETAELVKNTQSLAQWSAEAVPQEIADKLQAVTAASLPEEVVTYEISEAQEDGARRLSAVADVDDIGVTVLMLDSSFVAAEDLPYLNLMASLTGALATNQYDRNQVSQKLWQQVSSFSLQPQALKLDGENTAPVFLVKWLSLMDRYEDNLALVDEVLFGTDFSDTEMILRYVQSGLASLRQALSTGAVSYEQMRTIATGDPQYAYLMQMSGIGYLEFLTKVEQQLQEQPQVVTDKLKSIQQGLRNRRGAITLFAGSQAGVTQADGALKAYLQGLNDTQAASKDLGGIQMPSHREAVMVDTTVQFNMLYASLEQLDIQEDGRLKPVCALLNDLYLTPQLRQKLGVYTVLCAAGEQGLYIQTYRDPGLEDSFRVFEGAGDFLRGLSLTQEEINPYILSSYSALAMPTGALNGALSAMLERLTGDGPEKTLQQMREIKALSPDDMADMADLFDKLAQVGARSTWGSQAAIAKSINLFDAILTPLA